MKYKVHRLEATSINMQERLESFINQLNGEVISIFPNYAKTSLAQIYGATSKIDFLLVVEKTF